MDLRYLIDGSRNGGGLRGKGMICDLRSKISGGGALSRVGVQSSRFDLRNKLSSGLQDDIGTKYMDFDTLDDRLNDEVEVEPVSLRDARQLLRKRPKYDYYDLDDSTLVKDATFKHTFQTATDGLRRPAAVRNFDMRIQNDGARDQLLTQVTRLAATAAPSRKRTALRADFNNEEEEPTIGKKRAAVTSTTVIRPTKVIITNDQVKKSADLTKATKKGLSSQMQQRMQKKETPKPISVLITGLAASVSENDVKELCETIDGFVKSKMIDKGIAQATFKSLEQASEMIDQYDGREFDDSEMHIHILDDDEKRTPAEAGKVTVKKAVTSAPADTSSVEVQDDTDPNDRSLPAQKRRANNESQKKAKMNLSTDIVTSALHSRTNKNDVQFTIRMD